MKIMRIIARLNVGGPARHVLWLTARASAGVRATLVSGYVEANEAAMTHLIEREGVTPVYVPSLGRSLGIKDLLVFIRVLRLMIKIDPDIVDTHTAKAGMMGRFAAMLLNLFRKKKIRTVHTFHGHVLSGYFSRPVTAFFLAIERFLGRFGSDRIIVISEQQLKELAEVYRVAPRERFRLIRLGIDLDTFRPRGAQTDGEIRIGLVGRLTAIKDPLLFLEAGRMVHQAEPRAKLIVIGNGEMLAEMEELGHPGLEFLGNRDDIETLMPTLDVLVISSRNEGTPMSVIEAFASGVVVAGTKAGGVVDLLGDGRGLLSEIGDAEGLARNILRLIREPKLADEMREKAIAFAKENYSLERMIRETESLYKELARP